MKLNDFFSIENGAPSITLEAESADEVAFMRRILFDAHVDAAAFTGGQVVFDATNLFAHLRPLRFDKNLKVKKGKNNDATDPIHP